MKAIMHANEQGQGRAITIERERERVYEGKRVGGEGSEDEVIIKGMRVKRKGKMLLNERTRDSVITQSTTG